MAKVSNPKFKGGRLDCAECPYTPEGGGVILEIFWGKGYCKVCPTPETYAAACEIAAKAEKEAQG